MRLKANQWQALGRSSAGHQAHGRKREAKRAARRRNAAMAGQREFERCIADGTVHRRDDRLCQCLNGKSNLGHCRCTCHIALAARFAAEHGENDLWSTIDRRTFLIDQLDDISREGAPARLAPEQTGMFFDWAGKEVPW